MFNFNTRQLFNEPLNRISGGKSTVTGGAVRDTFSRWLNQPNWGWNDYVETKTRYLIDMGALRRTLCGMSPSFAQIRKALVAPGRYFRYGRHGHVFADFHCSGAIAGEA